MVVTPYKYMYFSDREYAFPQRSEVCFFSDSGDLLSRYFTDMYLPDMEKANDDSLLLAGKGTVLPLNYDCLLLGLTEEGKKDWERVIHLQQGDYMTNIIDILPKTSAEGWTVLLSAVEKTSALKETKLVSLSPDGFVVRNTEQ